MKDKLSIYFIVSVISILAAAIIGLVIAKFGMLSAAIIPVLVAGLVLSFFIFRSPFFGFLLILFFLPFERVPTYELAGVNLKINTILGFITLFAWVLALIFNYKKNILRPNVLAIPLVIFVIALMISLFSAVDLTRSIIVLVFIIFTILLSVLAVNMVDSKENLKKIILVLFLSSFVAGVFGLFQFGGDVIGLPQSLTLLKEGYTSKVFGFPRIQAFSMEPLYFANLLLIPIFLAFAFFFNRAEPIKRWWLVGLLAILLVNFILTVSRGGYLGFIIAFLVLGILLFKKVFTWRNILIGVATIMVVGYGVAFALSKGDYRATNEFIGHVMLKDISAGESIEGRLVTFERALTAYRQNPVFGVGIGNYGPWTKGYPMVRPEKGWDIVNNQYIELMAETGLVGTIAFGFLLLVLIVRSLVAFKITQDIFLKSVLAGLLAALAGILVQYNFMSTLYIIHIWVLVGLLVGAQNLIMKTRMTKSEIRKNVT